MNPSPNWDQGNKLIEKMVNNIEKVLIGKQSVIQLCLVALLAKGHVLLEDVPGVGKTMLVKALARSLGCKYRRIQFTPDLLPSDVTGVSIFNQKTLEFEFRPGPLMSNIVLADEINRTSPKTQAALLEALEEGSVTVDGHTYQLESPFFVMATQNPIEYEGTFPLPEAQLDRFLLKLSLGYPDTGQEMEMIKRFQYEHPINEVAEVWSRNDLHFLQQQVLNVYVDDAIVEYMVNIVKQTRNEPDLFLGASPRASLAIFRSSQALALIRGRMYVVPDDVKYLIPFTLSHRILLSSEAHMNGKTPEQVLERLLRQIPVPVT
ncbi:AAA family ATPase [Paenactinomyces guangxiensis]|uniref:MoxR family ATPase n=2 Tax=Paenactinomyces guangxiensis TaxID=1490290 RepID=A0A7W1WT46_9BACL|nr:MoxR family ATPase [Paenactinomyces guangxiensis]MBA4495591.1 MoxR family ATPase [Paenactinomyces guangxiensis]MBH8592849.1 MoxR family ATPase [Paenactinomyces guangxiensis]